ncbi:MAG: alpha-glucosidase [Caulobacteraceae bacterium]|nr:alpha-glucosidase [Caulobacter sp.]
MSGRDWRRGAAIYQVYPRSFADSNGDGVGDLPGITAHLDHVASLGVDAVWLSPFFTSPMADFGYDVSDPFDVDPIFGTLADFDALVARAHALGLKVVIDQVYCHLSDRSAWFRESRSSRSNAKADWFVWADPKPDGSPPNNWQSVFYGPAWTWDARRGQYYMHNFLPEQPQLNVHDPAVQDALCDVARFWLDRGVDGFRLDALNFMLHDRALRDNPPATDGKPRTRPFDYQDKLHNQSQPDTPAVIEKLQAVVSSYPDRFTVAEIGGDRALEEMRAYTSGPKRLDTAYSFTFLYADELTPALVLDALADWSPGASPGGWPSWAFSNHDAPRAISRWWPDRPTAQTAPLTLLLLATLRGNIFIWEGEELGLPQGEVPFERLVDPEAIRNWPKTLGRDGARTPMPWRADAPHAGFSPAEPWLPVDPRHAALAVDRQEADPGSTLQAARRILRFRQASDALRTGDLRPLPAAPGVLAFERGPADAPLLCVFNLGAAPAAGPAPDRWRIVLGTPGLAEGDRPPDRLPALAGYVAEPG